MNQIDFSEIELSPEYKKYLNSKEWKKLRQQKLKSVGSKCEECGCHVSDCRLVCHHKHYDSIFEEELDDLEVLCSKCHFYAHGWL